MTVSAGGATVVGFSFTNTEIPAGSGVLTVLGFSAITADATELSLGNFGALTDASGNTYDAAAGGSVDHPSDCAGTYYGDAVEDECGECGGNGPAENFDCDGNCLVDVDCAGDCGGSAVVDECGVCNGGGIADGACDCDGNVADCAGDCGGSAVVDDCGVCGGDGATAGFDCDGNCVDANTCGEVTLSFGAVTDSSAEVLYSSNFAVGGFQFDTDGVDLTGASSDLDAQFSGSTGIVIGFSMSGASLPAGDGVLAVLEFASSAAGSDLDVSGVVVSSAAGSTLASSGPGSTSVDGCYQTDCAGDC